VKFLDDLINSLDYDAPVKDIRSGIFHTGVWSRHCGLASSLTRDALKNHVEGEPLVREPGTLLHRSSRQLAELAYSELLVEAAIGVATINSLLKTDLRRCQRLNAFDLLAEKGQNKKIVIIGHFPFIPKLNNLARELRVIENNPQPGDESADASTLYLPQAEVVGLSGTTLTNHTFEGLMKLCNPRAYVMILGDSAPLSEVLFDYGIQAVSGTLVDDPHTALECISQGATYRQIKGISKLILER